MNGGAEMRQIVSRGMKKKIHLSIECMRRRICVDSCAVNTVDCGRDRVEYAT